MANRSITRKLWSVNHIPFLFICCKSLPAQKRNYPSKITAFFAEGFLGCMRQLELTIFWGNLIDKGSLPHYHKHIFWSRKDVPLRAARTVEERIAIIDEKISKKKADIKVLEAQKQKLLHPVTMKTVMEKAKASGLSPEEIAEKLGLEMWSENIERLTPSPRQPCMYM